MKHGLFTHLFQLFLTPDDGTGAGDTLSTDTPTPPAPNVDTPTPPAELTAEQQAAVDAEVQRQVSATIKSKTAAAEAKLAADLKALADAENMDAEQKANARAEAAEKAADARVAASNTRLITADAKVAALDAKANPARVDALLKLADLSEVTVDEDGNVDADAVKKAVNKALADFPEFKAEAAPKPGASAGEHGNQNQPKQSGLGGAIAAHYTG